MMLNLDSFSNSKVEYVFCDIDDTLTKSGYLQKSAFDAIWTLHNAGIQVIPITGRPAGWCELIARQWPVRGVVGENGGFYFSYTNKKMLRHFVFSESERLENRSKLDALAEEILQEVPGCALASDQFCRLMDLAIDFCEDVEPLDSSSVDQIVNIFKKHGAIAKISSIHVNGWFGDYDKLSMCKEFCSRELGFNLSESLEKVVFVGDSPNDEPMFAFFENSFGVANVKEFEDRLNKKPKFVSGKSHGDGFAEIAEKILALKN